MSANTTTFTDTNFQSEVLESSQPVLVDAHATWCGPCRALGPVIDQLATDFEGRAKIGNLDVDEKAGTAERYEIASIPTVFVFKNGEIVERLVGARPRQDYADALEKASA
jgi:thioredoxin 1